jgi:hypothetical protein
MGLDHYSRNIICFDEVIAGFPIIRVPLGGETTLLQSRWVSLKQPCHGRMRGRRLTSVYDNGPEFILS